MKITVIGAGNVGGLAAMRIAGDNPQKEVLIINRGGKLYFDLISILPKKTSRDGVDFGTFKMDKNRVLVCCNFKHVDGINFKYIVLPRYL